MVFKFSTTLLLLLFNLYIARYVPSPRTLAIVFNAIQNQWIMAPNNYTEIIQIRPDNTIRTLRSILDCSLELPNVFEYRYLVFGFYLLFKI